MASRVRRGRSAPQADPHPDSVAAAQQAEEAATQAATRWSLRGRSPPAFGAAAASEPGLRETWQPPAYGATKKAKTPISLQKAICFAPNMAFVVSALSFTFFWSEPVLPIFLSLLALMSVMKVGVPKTGVFQDGLEFAHLVSIGCGLLAIIAGMLIGTFAYENYSQQFLSALLGGSYDNVLASQTGAAYADAGKIRFAGTSTVDTSQALGYRDIVTYCVAPIKDSTGDQARSISFWAVGINCCGWRGEISCNDVGDANARGAVRAADDGVFIKTQDQYLRAANQAAANYDLVVGPNPIFVHWVADPTKYQWMALLYAFGVNLLGAGAFGLVTLAMLAAASLHGSGGGGQGESTPLV